MSAFQVNDEQINAIVQAVYGVTYDGKNIWQYQNDPEAYHYVEGLKHKAQAEANILMAENIRSVNYRYKNGANDKVNVVLKFNTPLMTPLAVLKLIDCLAYQSCETPDWKQSEAYKLLCDYREALIPRLAGWRDEKWSI